MPRKLPKDFDKRVENAESMVGPHAGRKPAAERTPDGHRINRTEALALLDWKNEKRPVEADVVYKLAQMGATYEDIGQWFGVTKATIYKKISSDLELLEAYQRGMAELKMSLRRKQLENAINNNHPIMQIWLGKQLLDQRDAPKEVVSDEEKKQALPAWLEEKLKASGSTSPSPANSDSTPI